MVSPSGITYSITRLVSLQYGQLSLSVQHLLSMFNLVFSVKQ